jgi:predicted dehydrogenase
MKKIHVAIIGAGLIGKKRAEAIQKLDQFSLERIFDVNTDAMNDFAERYACAKAESVDSIIKDTSIDLVVLAIAHKPAAEMAPDIVAHKHLLIEKPLGRNLKEAQAITEAAEKSGKHVFVGFNYIYYPHIRKAFEELHKGTVGELISSTLRIGHAAEPGYEKTWKMSKEVCGGGVIIDPGIHLLHLMISHIGYPDDFSVTSTNKGWNTDVEDEALIVFRHKDITFSTHHYSLNLSRNTLFIELIGTKGVIRATGRGGNYGSMKYSFVPRWHWKTNEKVISEDFGKEDSSFFDEMKDIPERLESAPDYSDYLETMKLLNALYEVHE